MQLGILDNGVYSAYEGTSVVNFFLKYNASRPNPLELTRW